MRFITGLLFALASAAKSFLADASAIHHGSNNHQQQSCNTITAVEISSMGNNSLFTTWRPYSHFMAPAGWMNDPCGSMYDPTRDLYTLFYQSHAEHIEWGNISWGFATSRDLITWTDHVGWEGYDAEALGPTGYGNYNGLGIFTGTAQPVNLQGEMDGTWTLFYTSVAHLPMSWDTYYPPFAETQSLATSTDGGKTFVQHSGNPVINTTTELAPMYWNLTGFRDPFFEQIPFLDALLGVSEPHWYVVMGSGIKGVGPRMPLWTAPLNDLTNWTFLGSLLEPAGNTSLGPVLSTRSWGYNFECANFFALPDSAGDLHYFIAMGAEGGNLTYAEYEHSALWNEGTLSRRSNGSAEFTPIAGGQADWGLAYAFQSFNDTKNNRRVLWGWAEEDIVGDGGIFSALQAGFQGAHTLPRHLFVHETENVIPDNELQQNMNSVLKQTDNGTVTAQTLGMRPLPDVVHGIRNGSAKHKFHSKTYNTSTILKQRGSRHMQFKATINSATGACGVIVGASPNMTEYTTIMYEPSNYTILVDRAHSSLIDEFNNATVTGYFFPYIVKSHGGYNTEPIKMDVFLDGSLLEVYVNNRFALTTRIYPSMECSTGYGLYVANGSSAAFDHLKSWEGLMNVWPERPHNSSSMLVFDTPAQTNNYTWWSGN